MKSIIVSIHFFLAIVISYGGAWCLGYCVILAMSLWAESPGELGYLISVMAFPILLPCVYSFLAASKLLASGKVIGGLMGLAGAALVGFMW
ncbi:hypothetical protein [Entomobacter blattae]|uniref:Uncharacterized protein n=1 Tax=Entomobacter blattae TaxID=2762277 RepID=A0A7H1NPQ0_9PROT|nr:hypothetical protein [Entomobacter blattae]QNT77760.1 hypothetical protein JGUZn3_05120 [Entomobacter blattae]